MIGLTEFDIHRLISDEARDARILTDINMKRMTELICSAVAKAIHANNKKIDLDIKTIIRTRR